MIVIDLGQSGVRADLNGEIHTLQRGKLAGESVLDAIKVIAKLLPDAQSDVVALSLTGLFGIVGDPEPFHSLARDLWGSQETAVMDDGLAGFYGALRGTNGVALTLGGGVVAVGGCEGVFSHTDGLGSIFGDEGSGYWLGSRAITRALATLDGRDTQNELLDALVQEVQAFEKLEVKNSTDAVLLAIGSAETILNSADLGIDAAIQIRNEGAYRLASTVIGAWRKAGGDKTGPPVIAISGGLSKNTSYVNEIARGVKAEISGATFIAPAGDNLDGARWIAENLRNDINPLLKWGRG